MRLLRYSLQSGVEHLLRQLFKKRDNEQSTNEDFESVSCDRDGTPMFKLEQHLKEVFAKILNVFLLQEANLIVCGLG